MARFESGRGRCPPHGGRRKLERRDTLRYIAAGVAAVVAGCGSDEPAANASGDSGDASPLRLDAHTLAESPLGNAHVTGTVTNTGDDEVPYVQVDARVYDEEGTRLGDGMDNATDVAPGETVGFEVRTTAAYDAVADYDIEVGTSL